MKKNVDGNSVKELKKLFLIMRLIILFLITSFVSVGANSYSQTARLSVNLKSVTIEEIFDAIENQSEYIFFYQDQNIDLNRMISIEVENKTINEVLDELFENTGNTYQIEDRQILIGFDKSTINKKEKHLQDEDLEADQSQKRTITGKVSDERGKSLPGASVVVKGTTVGVTTDMDGYYSLEIPDNAEMLVFSFVGMQTLEIPVSGKTSIDVSMEENAIGIDEVVAVGYGKMKKSDLTGAVAIIKSDDIAYKATANAAQALQGKVAGLQVTNSGSPGSSPVIRVRGLGSVRSDTEPLFVVDGVLTNDITFLGNNDIESITVLKDASASAIYGVRAANGVIIITTKRGNKDRILVNYSGYTGVQVPVDVMNMANAQEYIQLLNEKGEIAARKTGGSFIPYDASNYNVSTNWFDEVLRETASTSSHDLSISGGNEKTTFSTGLSFFEQQGLMLFDVYKRYNFRATVDSKVRNYLKTGFSFNLSNKKSHNSYNMAHAAFIAPPAVSPIDEETGNYMAMTEFGDYANPLVDLMFVDSNTNSNRLVGNLYLEFYLMKGLTFKSSYGVDGSYARDRIYRKPYELTGGTPSGEIERLQRKMTYNFNWYWDNTLTYTGQLTEQTAITAMLGISAQEQKLLWLFGSRLGVPLYENNNTLYLNLGTPDTQTNNDDGSHIASNSYFGRVNISHQEKYMLTATVRRDGSSIFPENNRYDIFPSVGLGWVLSKEGFMADNSVFEYLKLRASWGEMGNNKIPELTAVGTVDYGNWNSTEFGGVIHQGASATYIGPANLLWEKTQEYDLALEGYMMNSRLSFEVDLYSKKTIGAIFPVTVNSALGASNSSYLDNNADVLNKGVEISLGWKNNYRDFNYYFAPNLRILNEI